MMCHGGGGWVGGEYAHVIDMELVKTTDAYRKSENFHVKIFLCKKTWC